MQSPPPDEGLPVLTDIVELGPGVAAIPAVPEPEPDPQPTISPAIESPQPDSVLTRRVLELTDQALEEALNEAVVVLQERVRARLQRELPDLLQAAMAEQTTTQEQDKQG